MIDWMMFATLLCFSNFDQRVEIANLALIRFWCPRESIAPKRLTLLNYCLTRRLLNPPAVFILTISHLICCCHRLFLTRLRAVSHFSQGYVEWESTRARAKITSRRPDVLDYPWEIFISLSFFTVLTRGRAFFCFLQSQHTQCKSTGRCRNLTSSGIECPPKQVQRLP